MLCITTVLNRQAVRNPRWFSHRIENTLDTISVFLCLTLMKIKKSSINQPIVNIVQEQSFFITFKKTGIFT